MRGALALGGPLILVAAASCLAADLEHRIDALLEASSPMGFVGIQVVDAATGQTLYRRNEDRLFLPASNFKLVTSALALERLGPDYRFTTRVVHEASGNLVLAGSGDPSFSRRSYPYGKHAAFVDAGDHPIERLADQMVARGLTRVDGDIVGDDRLYPWEPYPASWTDDDKRNDYGAPVSALSLDDNVQSVLVRPGARVGDPATIEAERGFLTVESRIVSAAAGREPDIRVLRAGTSRQWILSGNIPLNHAAVAIAIPVDDPALFAASALHDALTRRGVAIRGRPVARHRLKGEPYIALAGEEIASRTSPPLTELIQMMDKESINLQAELLLRETGRLMQGDGGNETGLWALRAFLKEIGIADSEWRAEDGSGLARNDLATPRLLTQLLVREAAKYGDTWISFLPEGGQDGTLGHRLCCMTGGQGVRAKTGTLDRALALSGYAGGKTPGRVAFSILVNNFSAPPAVVRDWIDRIAVALLE